LAQHKTGAKKERSKSVRLSKRKGGVKGQGRLGDRRMSRKGGLSIGSLKKTGTRGFTQKSI